MQEALTETGLNKNHLDQYLGATIVKPFHTDGGIIKAGKITKQTLQNLYARGVESIPFGHIEGLMPEFKSPVISDISGDAYQQIKNIHEAVSQIYDVYGKKINDVRERSSHTVTTALFSVLGDPNNKLTPGMFIDDAEHHIASISKELYAPENTGAAMGIHALREHHGETMGHGVEVALISMMIADRFNKLSGGALGKNFVTETGNGGLHHDAGKGIVPLEIIDYPGRYDDAQKAIMDMHPFWGYELLSWLERAPNDVAFIAGLHHEEFGTGEQGYGIYSSKELVRAPMDEVIKNKLLLTKTAIVKVADVFSALMTKKRSYHNGRSFAEALMIMNDNCKQGKLSEEPYHILYDDIIDHHPGRLITEGMELRLPKSVVERTPGLDSDGWYSAVVDQEKTGHQARCYVLDDNHKDLPLRERIALQKTVDIDFTPELVKPVGNPVLAHLN